MDTGCLLCGGSFKMVNGQPCPNCKPDLKMVPKSMCIPIQYQGVKFDSSFIPMKMQKDYGTYMDKLMKEIVTNIGVFQKNILICSRPNSGKSVWAYSLCATLYDKGVECPPVMDIIEAKNLLNSYDKESAEKAKLLSMARCAVLKVPKDLQSWMFDVILYIIERRVQYNGFTIFLYGGTEYDIKEKDKYGKMQYLRGTGAYHTIEVKSFTS